MTAAYCGNLAAVKMLVEAGSDIEGWRNARAPTTPLIMAVQGSRAERFNQCDDYDAIVQYLLEHGADPLARDGSDMTPLSYSRMRPHFSRIALLLVEHIRQKGITPSPSLAVARPQKIGTSVPLKHEDQLRSWTRLKNKMKRLASWFD